MFTPLRHSIPGLESNPGSDSIQNILVLLHEGQAVLVSNDGFTIGSSAHCDLVLSDALVSPMHGVIHLQAGVIWIEAAHDSAEILVNDRRCRRMTLRNGDRIRIGVSELSVGSQSKSDAASDQGKSTIEEDLSLLTAEELCDRIISEHALVTEFNESRQAGWDALLEAIEAAKQEVLQEVQDQTSVESIELEHAVIEELLQQIQELNQTLTDRDQELTEREQEVLETTKLLEDEQREVTHRLDEVIDQLNQTDPPNELRASA